MKKLMLALLAVVVVAVVALVTFWPQVRLWQAQQALDRVLIPALKAQYQAAYGREPVVAYQGLTAEGEAFLARDLSLTLPGQPEMVFKVKEMRLDKADMGLWGDLKSCDLVLSGADLDVKGLTVGSQTLEIKITIAKVEAQGLGVSEGGMRIRLARKSAQDIEIMGPNLKAPVKIAQMEARDYEITAAAQWKSSQGSLGLMTLKTDGGVSVSLQGMTFSSDTPTWDKGQAYFDQAKIQARQFALGLPDLPGPGPALAMDELNMVLSRKPQRSADRVEVRGVTWQDKPGDKFQEALKELGYDHPRLDLTYDYVYDQAAKVFDCKEFTLTLAQAGSLSLSFLIKGMEADLAGDPLRNLGALKKAQPASLSLRYQDASLADKLLALGAKKEGLEPEAFRAKLLAELPPLPGALAPEPALKSFIQKPGLLCLKVTPRQELSVEEYGALGPALLATLEWKLDNCPQ
ncbi:MAG: hypothetical protein HY910_07860 [Desulfarculus sp.]|nr:hypothetical protein [Desulfarculus sp.]